MIKTAFGQFFVLGIYISVQLWYNIIVRKDTTTILQKYLKIRQGECVKNAGFYLLYLLDF